MKTAEEIAQDRQIILMNVFAKQQSIAFFIWHWRNYSSRPNVEEIEERYDEFEKQNEG